MSKIDDPAAMSELRTKVVFCAKVSLFPSVPMISISMSFLNNPIASLPLNPVMLLLRLSKTSLHIAAPPLAITYTSPLSILLLLGKL